MKGQNYLPIMAASVAIGKSILRKWETDIAMTKREKA